MELFAITCTTCQQRLKVRDASTIGEIQICPKCGSMVLVEPPAGWRETPEDEPPAPALPPTSPRQTVPAEAGFASGPEVASPPPVAADISAEPEVAAMDATNAGVVGVETDVESPPIAPVPTPPREGEGLALAAGTAKTCSGLRRRRSPQFGTTSAPASPRGSPVHPTACGPPRPAPRSSSPWPFASWGTRYSRGCSPARRTA